METGRQDPKYNDAKINAWLVVFNLVAADKGFFFCFLAAPSAKVALHNDSVQDPNHRVKPDSALCL